jgi:ADP-ribose pyrophosphatase
MKAQRLSTWPWTASSISITTQPKGHNIDNPISLFFSVLSFRVFLNSDDSENSYHQQEKSGLSREYPTRPIVGAGALILQDGKLLLTKRGSQPGRGRWSIPGGLVELGERVRDAAVRETKEEVGLDVEIVELVDAFDSITLDNQKRVQYHFVVVNFLARILGGRVRTASDILDAKWVPIDEVEKCDLTDSFRAFFAKHHEKIERSASCGEE